MRKLLICMLMNVAFFSTEAQTFSWAKKGGLWAYDYGFSNTYDPAGNVYVAGKYEKNANFSGTVLGCEGNHDIFVAKYSPSGNLLWIRTAGGSTGDYAHTITYHNGYVYVAGEIQGTNTTIKFQGSPITLTCKGDNDVFIAKYTLDGNLIWARRAGGSSSDRVLSIVADNMGHLYISGIYTNSATFGGTTISGYGDKDIFVAKYDLNGNFIWVRKAGSSGRDEGKAVRCDASGNVYVTGMYRDGCKFESQTLSSKGKWDMFLAKYSPSGTLLWVKKGGGSWDDVGWGMTIDSANNIFVTGEFNGSATFNNTNISTSGSSEIFVARYDVNGNVVWIKRAGGALRDRARAIATAGDRLYITGQYGATATFGPYTRTAADSSDIFVASLDKSGNFKWVSTVGGPADKYEDLGYESGIAISADMNGNVYVSGSTLNGGTFGSTTLSPWTRTDVFITKILSPPPGRSPEENEEIYTAAEDAPAREEEAGALRGMTAEYEEDYASQVNIYPNPNHGIFTIELGIEAATYDMLIYNSAGQIVSRRQLNPESVMPIDLSGCKQGVYFIELRNGEACFRKKIVLQ